MQRIYEFNIGDKAWNKRVQGAGVSSMSIGTVIPVKILHFGTIMDLIPIPVEEI